MHIHFKIGKKHQMEHLVKRFQFSESKLYEDTFYDLFNANGGYSDKNSFWLRKRGLSSGDCFPPSDIQWTLTETRKDENGVHVIQSHGEASILAHMKTAGDLPEQYILSCADFGKNQSSLATFRFWRRTAKNDQFGVANMDRTLFGTFITCEVQTQAQFDAVMLNFGSTLEKCSSKVRSRIDNPDFFDFDESFEKFEIGCLPTTADQFE